MKFTVKYFYLSLLSKFYQLLVKLSFIISKISIAMKTLIITSLFFLFHLSEYSQDLSLLQSFTVKIENEENIPTVSENEVNTLNVVFKQEHINEIFSKYKLFSFKKFFPTTNSETLRKLYTFSCNSRAIVNELVNNVSSEVLSFNFPYEVNPIDDEMK